MAVARRARPAAYGADNVAALIQGVPDLFRLGMHGPGARLRLVGQAQALQALQAPDQQQALTLRAGFVESFDSYWAILGTGPRCYR